jgi:UDP-N-acetylmuramate--alanine ligase
MKHLESVKHIYFLGIGGIGMSALARYFKAIGKTVSGYDKTKTKLTLNLSDEGILIHYEDLGQNICSVLNSNETLVVRTPAIPENFGELMALRNASFDILKRAEILGIITQNSFGIGVAGTHGKTTTSTMLAHLLHQTIGCNAFLGGISSNYNSNLILNASSKVSVIEADEYDRSFLHLKPKAGVLTSIDADHLDIYGDKNNIVQGFQDYINLIDENGFLLIQHQIPLNAACEIVPYGLHAKTGIAGSNLRVESGQFLFDVTINNEHWQGVELGIPGTHNAENALAVIGIANKLGLDENQIRHGLATFKGVKRRFEYVIRRNDLVYIDDYAHHPSEIAVLIDSIQLIYPNKKITGIFQPHLFTRTRDFMDGFASELSRLDELILMPIYPARELPIFGVDSAALQERLTLKNTSLLNHDETLKYLEKKQPEILLTIGAGDIDLLVEPLKQLFS